MIRITGIALLIAGIVLLSFGIYAALAISEIIIAGVTGSFTKTTMAYLISGSSLFVAGGVLTYLGRNKKKRKRWLA